MFIETNDPAHDTVRRLVLRNINDRIAALNRIKDKVVDAEPLGDSVADLAILTVGSNNEESLFITTICKYDVDARNRENDDCYFQPKGEIE